MKRLIQNGFNLRRFKNIDLKQDKDILLDTISNFKLYCTKHNYYYSENSECPICKDTIYIVEKKMLENYEQIYKDDIATHYKVEGNE